MAARTPIGAKSRVGAKRGPKSTSRMNTRQLGCGPGRGRAVREYLESLRANRPRRGRRRTPDSIRARLKATEVELQEADPTTELELRQERRDLEQELHQRSASVDQASIEKAFISVAKSHSERQGINYSTWREIGVDAAVLKKAGRATGRARQSARVIMGLSRTACSRLRVAPTQRNLACVCTPGPKPTTRTGPSPMRAAPSPR